MNILNIFATFVALGAALVTACRRKRHHNMSYIDYRRGQERYVFIYGGTVADLPVLARAVMDQVVANDLSLTMHDYHVILSLAKDQLYGGK